MFISLSQKNAVIVSVPYVELNENTFTPKAFAISFAVKVHFSFGITVRILRETFWWERKRTKSIVALNLDTKQLTHSQISPSWECCQHWSCFITVYVCVILLWREHNKKICQVIFLSFCEILLKGKHQLAEILK